MDDTFQNYINRVVRLTLPEAHKAQVQHIQPSPKFYSQSDKPAEPAPFPGFSVITPPWEEDSENGAFYEQMRDLQQQVVESIPNHLVVAVPPESFHFTLADLIWDSAYRHAAIDPTFDAQLCDRIAEIFRDNQAALRSQTPLYWQAVGLSMRTRAIGVCLAPKDELSYEQVLRLRRALYQDEALIALGIEQQYHLTAHITLGYFGNLSDDVSRDHISDTLSTLNLQWLETVTPQPFLLHRAELRKFDNMIHYYRGPDWPIVTFQ